MILYCGDIIEPVPGWKECLEMFVRSVDLSYLWVRGNNDFVAEAYRGPVSRGVHWVRGKAIYVHTGVNIPGTPWAQAHDVATYDQVDRFYGEMASDCLDSAAIEQIQVIATHYPFITNSTFRLTFDQKLRKLLSQLPALKHIVFGHVHANEYYEVDQDGDSTPGGNMADVIPKSLTFGDRTVQIHLVSDHRKKLIHEIGGI